MELPSGRFAFGGAHEARRNTYPGHALCRAARCDGAAGRGAPRGHRAARHAPVQPVVPRLPHQAAGDEPAVRARAVPGFARRAGARVAQFHRERLAAHARFQAPLQACRDRRHRRVHQDDCAGRPIDETENAMRIPVFFLALSFLAPAYPAEAVLSGSVSESHGGKMAGVAVSAKPAGGTITTTVYSDKAGNYTFPPLPAAKYRVWAQALGYETAKSEVDLSASAKRNFELVAMTDAEQVIRQLPGNLVLDALPEATEQDRRMKQLVRNDCTSCHTASYPLQHRFDEAGWNAIIELMKNANVYGTYVAKDREPSGILDFHQKELAAYLAKARGPGKTAMRVKLDPRPSGEAARVVIREYDLPLDPDANLPAGFVQNDGSDWSRGTPSVMIPGWGVHDAWLDDAGNVWFTCNIPNKRTSLGKLDTRTGEVRLVNIPAKNGLAAQSHGMTRTPDGILWFNINPGRGGLGRVDPKTEKIDVFIPPESM